MTRQQKYPDTSTFHYYNANPKNRYTTDCVIRAICTATEIPYNQVVMEMAELQCKTGFDMSENKLIDKYLSAKGWVKHSQPKKADGTKYTGKEWCKELWWIGEHNKMIANIGGHHIVAIVEDNEYDGNGISRFRVYDIWDSTDKCIGNYWTKA